MNRISLIALLIPSLYRAYVPETSINLTMGAQDITPESPTIEIPHLNNNLLDVEDVQTAEDLNTESRGTTASPVDINSSSESAQTNAGKTRNSGEISNPNVLANSVPTVESVIDNSGINLINEKIATDEEISIISDENNNSQVTQPITSPLPDSEKKFPFSKTPSAESPADLQKSFDSGVENSVSESRTSSPMVMDNQEDSTPVPLPRDHKRSDTPENLSINPIPNPSSNPNGKPEIMISNMNMVNAFDEEYKKLAGAKNCVETQINDIQQIRLLLEELKASLQNTITVFDAQILKIKFSTLEKCKEVLDDARDKCLKQIMCQLRV